MEFLSPPGGADFGPSFSSPLSRAPGLSPSVAAHAAQLPRSHALPLAARPRPSAMPALTIALSLAGGPRLSALSLARDRLWTRSPPATARPVASPLLTHQQGSVPCVPVSLRLPQAIPSSPSAEPSRRHCLPSSPPRQASPVLATSPPPSLVAYKRDRPSSSFLNTTFDHLSSPSSGSIEPACHPLPLLR
jgi:hypothetical protein